MNLTASQERTRTSLGSPHASGYASTAYSYGPSAVNNMGSGGFGVGSGQVLSDSLTQARPHYQPGYLLSLAQSQSIPLPGQRHEEPFLIPIRAKMSAAYPRNAPSDFGSDSIFETTSKHRHRETATDEDGPPTSSVVDIVSDIHTDSRRQLRNITRLGTSQKSNNRPPTPTSAQHQILYVVVYGYPPSRYSCTLAYFQAMADGGTTEPEHSLDVENAFRIGYKHPWEAARAFRKNGDIMSGEGGRWMVGVKWVDPIAAEHVLGSGARISMSSSAGAETPPSSQGRPAMLLDPALSQLQHVNAAPEESAPSIGTPIKLAPSAAAFRRGTPDVGGKASTVQTHNAFNSPSSSKGMFGQVSELIFGW